MRVRTLETDSELTLYALRFADTVRRRSRGRMHSSVDVDYLRRCKVRGVFDADGEMVAGYALGTAGPYRLIEFVPPEHRDALRPPPGTRWEDCCEVVCMWRSERMPRAGMNQVWPRVLLDCMTAGRSVILGHNESPGLDELYIRMGAETLYQGVSVNGLPSRLFAYRRRRLLERLVHYVAIEAPARLFRHHQTTSAGQRT